jgi:hypothetical protein
LRRFEFTDLLVLAAKVVSKARLGSDYEELGDLSLKVNEALKD